MAARVNKQFVILLVSICLGVAIIVGALAVWAYRQDAARNIRSGDRYMAASQFELAADQYGRAVSKERSNLEFLNKFESALLRIRPLTQADAEERYRQSLSVLMQRVRLRPENIEFQMRLLDELEENARLVNAHNFWRELSEVADRALGRIPDDAVDERIEIEYLRLFADARRSGTMTQTDLDQLDLRFQEFVRAHPDHIDARAAYADWQVNLSNRDFLASDPRRAEERLARADEHIATARASGSDSLDLALADVSRHFSRLTLSREGVSAETATALAERVYEQARRVDSPWVLDVCTRVLPGIGGLRGAELAAALCEEYLERRPDSMFARISLAHLAFEINQHDRVRTLVREVVESPPLETSFMAQFRFDLRRRAAKLLFDVEAIQTAQLAADQRAARMDDVRAAREQVVRLVSNPESHPMVRECDAWIAYLQGDQRAAASGFDQAIRAYDSQERSVSWRLLWAAAETFEAEGAPGRARDLLRRAAAQVPSSVPVLANLARLELQMNQNDAAFEIARRAYGIDPENPLVHAVYSQAARLLGREIEDVDLAASGGIAGGIQSILEQAATLINDDDLAGARAILIAAHEQHPENLSIIYALLITEVRGGWSDDALARLETLIEQFPRDARLRALHEQLRGADEVTIIERLAAVEHADDPDRQHLAIWVSLQQAARQRDEQARLLRVRGDREEAARAEQQAARFRQAADIRHDSISQSIRSSDPDYLNERLNQLLADPAFTTGGPRRAEVRREAEEIVAKARTLNIDGSGGLITRARLELARGDYESAIATLDAASRAKPYSPLVWRSLGYAHERMGNKHDASRCYQQALELQPNDPTTVQLSTRLLVEIGERPRALEILRNAAGRGQANPAIIDAWLLLEGEVGDAYAAIKRRREHYENQPTDRNNALQLASLLGRTMPDRAAILRSDGTERYTDRQWHILRPAEREAAVAQVKNEWLAEADRIFRQLDADRSDDLNVRLARAFFYRDTGRTPHGAEMLARFVNEQGPQRRDSSVYIGHAQFLTSIGDNNAAIETLRNGLEYQSEEQREIDLFIGSLLMRARQYEQAITHLTKVHEATADLNVGLQIVEAELHLRRFEEADTLLASIERAHGTEFQIELLRARIRTGQADDLFRQERNEQAQRRIREAQVAIETAQRLSPSHPWPHVLRAMMKLDEFNRTGRERTTLLNDADVDLTRALELQSNFVPARRLRSELMLAKSPPDFQGAVRQFEHLLRDNPRDDQSRAMMVELYERAGDRPRALETAREGIALDPQKPQWYQQAAELHTRDGRFDLAVPRYLEAFERSGSLAMLQSWADASLRMQPPRPGDVIARLENNEQAITRMITLRPILARAYALAGRWDDAVNALRKAYTEHHEVARTTEQHQAIAFWMSEAIEIYRTRGIGQLDALVRELSEGSLTQNERYFLALAWMRSGDPQGYERSIALLNEAVEAAGPDDFEDRTALNLQLGRVYWVKGDFSPAVEHFRKALEIRPDHPEALNDLAFTLTSGLNDPDSALPYARRAAELMPTNASVLDTLGATLLKLGNLAEAERVLLRSIEIQAQPDNHLHLGQVYLERGERARARQYLEQALRLRPTDRTREEVQRLLDDIRP